MLNGKFFNLESLKIRLVLRFKIRLSAKSCVSQYCDKLYISIKSISSADQTSFGQTGPWYWVNGVK